PNGNTGTFHYWDYSYTGTSPVGNDRTDRAPLTGGVGLLSDGITGSTSAVGGPTCDPVKPLCYEWVGWVPHAFTIAFDFGSVQSLSDARFFTANEATA